MVATMLRTLIGAIALVGILSSPPALAGGEPPDSYLASSALLERAMSRLMERAGRTPKVLRIAVVRDEIAVLVQGEGRPSDIDEWKVRLFQRFLMDRDIVSGPVALQGDGIVDEAEPGFFTLSEVALADLADLNRRAIARASLEDPAEVTRATIEKRISILPEPAYGALRWNLEVRSDRETAQVYATPIGEIIGADLSQTHRARRLDLLGDDNWPLDQAAAELGYALGDTQSLHELRIYKTYIFAEADHPEDPEQARSYSWDLSGVRHGLVDTPNLFDLSSRNSERFRFSEIDLTLVPKLKANAREALAMTDGAITALSAAKTLGIAGPASVIWNIEVTDKNGERGMVRAAADGRVVSVLLPESRRPREEWLAPATLVKTLRRITGELGGGARLSRITIDGNNALIEAEDPGQPGMVATFRLNSDGIARFTPPMSPFMEAEFFTAEEIAALDEAFFAALAERTLTRMNLEGAAVHRYTIARQGVMVASRQGKPIVEVRAGKNHGWVGGWVGGWVVYEIDGTEIDVVTP